MPRQSTQPGHTSPGAPVASKRRASARLSVTEPEVKRVKSNTDLSLRQAHSTTSKSKYFEPEDSEPVSESEASGEDSGSEYEETKEESSPEVEPEGLSDSDEDTKAQHTARGKPRQSSGISKSLKGKELWREGVRSGLEPGQEVIVAKPKARDAGKTPYQDETLHPNTKLFLIDLADNNDRQWLKGELRTYTV